MPKRYFGDLKKNTPTRFWINNPTLEETYLALEQGAFGCTTNPAYCSRLLRDEREYITGVIDEALRAGQGIEHTAEEVYRRCTKRIMDVFLETYQKSNGTQGFVTIQDDPRRDEDTDRMIGAVEENRKLGPNFMAKIPVIPGAIEAIEYCVEENIPICATEVFALSQAQVISDAYRKASRRSGNTPVMYLTHISGIFDEYLGKTAKREGIEIEEQLLTQAGLSVARKQYRMMQQIDISAVLLGGGARGTHHFTGLSGGDAHITINWSTAVEIMNLESIPEDDIYAVTPSSVIDELSNKFTDYSKAYREEGLSLDEFSSFGPVQLFRNAFLKGWYDLLAAVAERKHALAL